MEDFLASINNKNKISTHNISTIEKRYDLNSSFTGVISAGYDISFCVLCLFISFYGEKGHKPRWLAFASLMIALGALVFSLPHFTVGAYTYGEKLEGIGYAMSLLGPAIGYVLGGQLLNVYVDFDRQVRTGTLSNLTAPCNAHCRCMRSEFLPVCGADEVQYFSPCYAGCTSVFVHNQCSCVGDPKIVIENTTAGAIPGKCKSKCTVLPWFLSFFFLTVVFTFMAVTPTTVAILSIPGPILFGVSIDHTCTLWSIDKCGIQGACWTYDNKKMAFTLMGISKNKSCAMLFFWWPGMIFYSPLLIDHDRREVTVCKLQVYIRRMRQLWISRSPSTQISRRCW
uniref:Kazal-like domain-containing protein n=1 Tax=Varanus komodoensis TaxID=61221 RepID=A0A8D2Q6G6_VARKO